MERGLAGLAGKVVAFEGLDGAGKSTVLGVLAKRLRQAGCTVFLPRMGKDHSSRPARMIRELTRDRCNLELRPRAERELYCAREAQILDEQVRPAIARGHTVLLDRSILTSVVLGSYGRGLPLDECETAARVASGGLEPDFTVILDVHPRTSRIRKRLDRARNPKVRDPSRKGLSGSGLKERIREGYRELAADRGYLLFHTERVSPKVVAERVVEALATGALPRDLEAPGDEVPAWQLSAELDTEDWAEALAELPEDLALYMTRGLIAGRELRRAAVDREPRLVAWALDSEDPLRLTIASQVPEHALSGWTRRPLSGDDDLRVQLMHQAPGPVARALRHLSDERADRMREQLAEPAPGEVLESLAGREDATACALRQRLWEAGSVAQAAASLLGCTGEPASRLREELFERDPAIALRSLRGLRDDRTRELLGHYAPLAPKAVLQAITGDGSDFAHDLRRQLHATGREVVDSLGPLDDEPSLALREAHAERWPSTVLGSLVATAPSARIDALLDQCKSSGAGDVHVLRQLAARQERDQRPAWKRSEAADLEGMED